VIAQDVAALGRAAANLLFARLGGEDSPPHQLTLPVHLIARGSGEVRP
jgi:LacI family transcriptional regulator